MAGSNKRNSLANAEMIGGLVLVVALVASWYFFYERPRIIAEREERIAMEADRINGLRFIGGTVVKVSGTLITISAPVSEREDANFDIQTDANTTFNLIADDDIITTEGVSLASIHVGDIISVESNGPVVNQKPIYGAKISKFE